MKSCLKSCYWLISKDALEYLSDIFGEDLTSWKDHLLSIITEDYIYIVYDKGVDYYRWLPYTVYVENFLSNGYVNMGTYDIKYIRKKKLESLYE